MKPIKVICPYCHKEAVLHHTSEKFYNGTNYGPVWVCEPCDALVGCHKYSESFAPLGKPANKQDRQVRMAAHQAFDGLWPEVMGQKVRQSEARQMAYIWLAFELGINPHDCHIGEFSGAMCRRVIKICKSYRERTEAKP